MISSTISDMKNERDAIDNLISSYNFNVLRSETMGAIGVSPREICERMAIACDLYIGVFGSRYGSVIEDDNISVTEMEYDIAKSLDPTKILVYLKEDNRDRDADARQVAFREKVTDFSTGYFRHRKYDLVEELVEQVKKDMASWITERVKRTKDLELAVRILTIDVEAFKEKMEVLSEARGI